MSKEKKINSFEEKIQTTIKMDIPQPRHEFKEQLSERLTEQSLLKSEKKEGFKSLRLKPARAIAFSAALLVIVITFAIGPKNIYAAIQNLLRYIPGIGIVEAGRVLADSASVERDGINLTVQEMVVNEEETILIYYVDNLPMEKLFEYIKENNIGEFGQLDDYEPIIYFLKTSNGEIIQGEHIAGYTTNKQDGTDWTGKVVFPALPSGSTEVEFLMNYLPHMYPNIAPEDWVVPVSLKVVDETTEPSFVYQPAFTTVIPVMTDLPQAVDSTETEALPELKNEVELLLNAVSITEDQIVLSISVDWERENWHGAAIIDFIRLRETASGGDLPHTLSLQDANGTEIPLVYNDHENSEYGFSERSRIFIFNGEITGLDLENPLTLELNGVYFSASLFDENIQSFEFTPDSELLPGECGDFFRSMTVYDFQLYFVKVCLVENPKSHGGGGGPGITPPPPSKYALELYMTLSQNLFGASASDIGCRADADEHLNNCAAGYGVPFEEGFMISGTEYYEMPVFPIEYKVMGVDFFLEGPWVIEFDLP